MQTGAENSRCGSTRAVKAKECLKPFKVGIVEVLISGGLLLEIYTYCNFGELPSVRPIC